jgi:hypothetical protein
MSSSNRCPLLSFFTAPSLKQQCSRKDAKNQAKLSVNLNFGDGSRKTNQNLAQESIDRQGRLEYYDSAVVFGFWCVANAAAGKVRLN